MAIGDDFSVAVNGDIRHVANSNTYTVIEFHRWLQDLADDSSGSGNDLLDITDDTPSERSTDNIITLNSPYNIDDDAAEYLYDGSITQAGGDDVYSGLVVVGSVESGTELQIVQNNALITSYWGTGLNANAAANILLRIMVKTRSAGSDIDGKRLRVQARELGDTYAEFSLTAGLGNSTAAIFTASDLNNQTAAGTIATWSTISNVEGYQGIDIDGDTVNEFYYSQWNRDTYTINQLYERTKWIQRRGTSETIHGVNGELFRGITHEIPYDTEASGPFQEDELITWTGGGEGILLALDDQGTTGTLWIQLTKGVAPTDPTTLTGGTSSATAEVNGAVTARTVSPEFLGTSTGSAVIGAYGIGIEVADVTNADQLFDLTNTLRVPPNNVTFTVGGLVNTEDRVLVGPEAGGGIDFDQLTGATGSNASGAGTWVVNEAIPSDTPSSGTVRVFNGTTYDRVPYTSWASSTFTLTGTLPSAGASHQIWYDNEASGPFTVTETLTFGGGGTAELLVLNDEGLTGNMIIRMISGSDPVDNDTISGGTSSATADVDTGTGGGSPVDSVGGFISYIDELASGATATFTSVYSSDRSLFIRVRDGAVTPIKTFETTGTLGSSGGSTTAIRTSDE